MKDGQPKEAPLIEQLLAQNGIEHFVSQGRAPVFVPVEVYPPYDVDRLHVEPEKKFLMIVPPLSYEGDRVINRAYDDILYEYVSPSGKSRGFATLDTISAEQTVKLQQRISAYKQNSS